TANKFQSTHPHGVRRFSACLIKGERRFNPRTHTGCDTSKTGVHIHDCIVSIHAPTRGATVCKVTYYKSIN
ncbi:hypothetical protein DW984_22295, partial [Parabacteroides distasonis]